MRVYREVAENVFRIAVVHADWWAENVWNECLHGDIQIKFNHEKLEEKKKELTEFEGWLPFRFYRYINLDERREYLRSKRLYKEIEKANPDYMLIFRHNLKPNELMEELIIEFIQDNPQFKDIIL